MNILFAVHQFFPNHYTGTERVVLNLSKQLQHMGHSVTVLTYGLLEKEGFRTEGKCYVKEYYYDSVRVVSIRHIQISNDVSFKIFDDDLGQFCDGFLARENFDIVHVCHPMRVGAVIRSAKKKKIPVILTLTDFWLMCPRGIGVTPDLELCTGSVDGKKCFSRCYGDPWGIKITQRFKDTWEVFQSADKVVCATEFLKGMYESQGYSKDILIIRFGTDYRNIIQNTKTYNDASEITLGYLSYLSFHKGAHILVSAFCQADCPNISLVIYGDATGDEDFFSQLKTIGKKNTRIEYRGRYSYENLPDILNNLDIVVLPSLWWENSPLVLLSSLAHNVPALVSDLGGMTENIKDGVNGFSFRTGDAGDLARIIKEISRDPKILNTLKSRIVPPPRIEEEAFFYEKLYRSLRQPDSLQRNANENQTPSHSDIPDSMEKPVDLTAVTAVPQSALIAALQKKYGPSFVSEINPCDKMFQFLVNHPDIGDPYGEYFRSGESMIVTLQEIFSDQKIHFSSITSFLDFASGYGRFTRFLIFNIPSEKITVCDIEKKAVDFCKEKFAVDGYYSSEDPEDLTIQKTYDVIWVASLFSHLSLQSWRRWLKKLSGMLNRGGIIIFSTHGSHCFNQLDDLTKRNILHQYEGFDFIRKSEIDILPNDKYGTTYVTEKFVRDFVENNQLGIITGYYPKKLWEFQDIYVLKKDYPAT